MKKKKKYFRENNITFIVLRVKKKNVKFIICVIVEFYCIYI